MPRFQSRRREDTVQQKRYTNGTARAHIDEEQRKLLEKKAKYQTQRSANEVA